MPQKRFARWLLGAAVGAVVSSMTASTWAQATPPATPPTQPATQGAPAAPEFKWPDFAVMTKDMQPTAGMFTVFRFNPNDPSKDHSKLLCEIPRGLLKQDLLLAVSASRGAYAGWQLDDYLIRFEMVGRQIRITLPDSRYVQQPGKELTEAINRTYTSRFLASMPILTLSPAGNPVVDFGPVFMGAGIGVYTRPGMMAPRRDMSEVTKVKVFPDNALIDVDLAMATLGGGGESIGLSYAFRRLPAVGEYKPRAADERIGFFVTARQDWNLPYTNRENFVRYIDRWDIKKKDPSLEMSPPDKPIVFVIERSVPLRWRRFVKEGIEEWNKAFEKVGIVGAIVVQQQTEDNEFANVDPEDARYNFIRWTVRGEALAVGPRRADPRTGQILDADIILDDAWLRFFHDQTGTFSASTVSSTLSTDTLEFLEKNPAFIPMGNTLEEVKETRRALQGDLLRDLMPGAKKVPGASDFGAGSLHVDRPANEHIRCNHAQGLQHQVAMMHVMAAAGAAGIDGKVPERLIGQLLRELIMHEVGHTLGMRHNFKGSAWLSMEEIKRRRDGGSEPTVASVMDYNPILFFPGDKPDAIKNYITPTVGPYDEWTIEYGYKNPGKDDGSEAAMLSKIAQQNTKKENAFATDEDTMGLLSVDPYSNDYDMGDDPIAWAKMRSELSDQLLKDVKKWAVKNDEPNHHLRRVVTSILFEKKRNMGYVSRLVGGQVFHRNRPGDPDAKPALVLLEPKKQREALAWMGETVFDDKFVTLQAELLNELAPARWYDWTFNPMRRVDFPAHQMLASMQSEALLAVCSPQVLQRVYDAELKSTGEDKFTSAELLTSVRNIVWCNLTVAEDAAFTDSKPMMSSIRRNLQRQHLQYLLAIVDSEPGALVSADLQSMVRYTLRDLNQQIGKVLEKAKSADNGSKLDVGTRAHLTEAKSQIDRVLDAPYIKMPQPRLLLLGRETGVGEQETQHR